jgi:hypothetical protein
MTKKRRATIGRDPLDALLSPPATLPAPSRAPAASEVPPQTRKRKVKATFLLPADVVNEARDATVALAGPPLRLTLATLVEGALRRELARLKKEHHQGKPFPKHDAPLIGGRPIGTKHT